MWRPRVSDKSPDQCWPINILWSICRRDPCIVLVMVASSPENKHNTLTQCCFNFGLASEILAQLWNSVMYHYIAGALVVWLKLPLVTPELVPAPVFRFQINMMFSSLSTRKYSILWEAFVTETDLVTDSIQIVIFHGMTAHQFLGSTLSAHW